MVKGRAQFRRRLQRVPLLVEREVRFEMERQADRIVAAMKQSAPVLKSPDKRRRAGALRDSIDWTWGSPPGGTIAIGGVRGKGGLKLTIYAGTRDKTLGRDDAYYARFQEFGTKKAPAQPFFYPTYRANRTPARAAITRAVRRGFKKV